VADDILIWVVDDRSVVGEGVEEISYPRTRLLPRLHRWIPASKSKLHETGCVVCSMTPIPTAGVLGTDSFNLCSSLPMVGEVKAICSGMSLKQASLRQLSSTSRKWSCTIALEGMIV
jgi:hypothetical protein